MTRIVSFRNLTLSLGSAVAALTSPLTLTLRRESASLHSMLYLFEKDGWFLKYRITHDRAVREFLRDQVTTFVRETVDAVEVAVTSRAVGSPAGKP